MPSSTRPRPPEQSGPLEARGFKRAAAASPARNRASQGAAKTPQAQTRRTPRSPTWPVRATQPLTSHRRRGRWPGHVRPRLAVLVLLNPRRMRAAGRRREASTRLAAVLAGDHAFFRAAGFALRLGLASCVLEKSEPNGLHRSARPA